MSRHRHVRNLRHEDYMDDYDDDDDYFDDDDDSDDSEESDEYTEAVSMIEDLLGSGTTQQFPRAQIIGAIRKFHGDANAALDHLLQQSTFAEEKANNNNKPKKNQRDKKNNNSKRNPKMAQVRAITKQLSQSSLQKETKEPKLKLDASLEYSADKHVKPLYVAVAGHVDTGKSTLLGHLLYLLSQVSEKDLKRQTQQAVLEKKPSFAFAYNLDSSLEEQQRGVTVGTIATQLVLPHSNRAIVINDNPGHRDFVAHMICGSARADCAVLVVSALRNEFLKGFSAEAQTREHLVLLRAFGVEHLVVAINKIDMVNAKDQTREGQHDSALQEAIAMIHEELDPFLFRELHFKRENVQWVPCSGLKGINLVGSGAEFSITGALSTVPMPNRAELALDSRLRFYVDDVLDADESNNTCKVSGRLRSGNLQPNVRNAYQLIAGNNAKSDLLVNKIVDESSGDLLQIAFCDGVPLILHLSGMQPSLINRFSVIAEKPSGKDTGTLKNIGSDCFAVQLRMLDLSGSQTMPLILGTSFILYAQGWEVPGVLTGFKEPKRRFLRKSEKGECDIQTTHFVALEPNERFVLRVNGVTIAYGKILQTLDVSNNSLDQTQFATGE